MGRNGLVGTIRLSITPTANRNSCRVARLVGAVTQGVLCPQPWAGKSQLLQSCRWVRTIPPLGHLCPLKLLQPTPTHAPSSPCLLHPTTPPASSTPHLLQPTPRSALSSPRLHLPTPTPTSSYPHLLQPTPTPTPSSPRLHLPTTPLTPSTPHLHLPTPTPTPSSPRLHLPTTPPTQSSPCLHHTAWGDWTALFLQKWG